MTKTIQQMLSKGLTSLLIMLIRLYQLTLSPFIGNQCRFYPSCSHYAIQALRCHGTVRGSYLIIKRLARCQPFHSGGVDDVPKPDHICSN